MVNYKTTFLDLSKLSDIVKSDVVKKDVYNAKIKDIEDKILDITNLAITTTFHAQINVVKNEIPTAALNTKINEVKNKIPNIANLATTTALTAVDKEQTHHSKYITSPEFDELTPENFTARLKLENLSAKGDIADFVKKIGFDDKLKNSNKKATANKSKHVSVENELKRQQDKIEKLHMIQVISSTKATYQRNFR